MNMDINQIKKLIDDHVDLITITASSLVNSRELSSKFLVAQSLLATFLKDFEDDKSKLVTVKEATYAISIKSAEGKTITEKKVSVNLDANYTNAREAVEQIENIRDYIKVHMKIFENAHLLYRQFSRD